MLVVLTRIIAGRLIYFKKDAARKPNASLTCKAKLLRSVNVWRKPAVALTALAMAFALSIPALLKFKTTKRTGVKIKTNLSTASITHSSKKIRSLLIGKSVLQKSISLMLTWVLK